MAEALSADQVDAFKEAFDLFDKDGDGSITTEEVSVVMRSLGKDLTEAEVNDMVAELDADGDGEIDFPEFLTLMARKITDADTEEEVKSAFATFNLSGSGLLSSEDLKRIMTDMGESPSDDELAAMLLIADKDGDGHVNFSEFAAMIQG